MRTNPFYDAWLFLLGQTGDHQGSGVGGLLTILFLVLLAASFWIAIRNWRSDAAQRTGAHLGTWLMRVMIGAMWFSGLAVEVTFAGFRGLQILDRAARHQRCI